MPPSITSRKVHGMIVGALCVFVISKSHDFHDLFPLVVDNVVFKVDNDIKEIAIGKCTGDEMCLTLDCKGYTFLMEHTGKADSHVHRCIDMDIFSYLSLSIKTIRE